MPRYGLFLGVMVCISVSLSWASIPELDGLNYQAHENLHSIIEADPTRMAVMRNRNNTARYSPVNIDPTDRLVDNSQSTKGRSAFQAGQWNRAGDFEGWTLKNCTHTSVTDGILSATASADGPSVQLLNMSGPDLDFGYFDYLQIRLRLPSGARNAISFTYGTSGHRGLRADHRFLIPADVLATDGNWHSYRIDLGYLETAWWREHLTDLQIKPLGDKGKGQSFAIDYVEIGDLRGDVLGVYYGSVNLPKGYTLADMHSMESKHAVMWWCDITYQKYAAYDPDTFGRINLRIMEDCYDIFAKHMNLFPPVWDNDGSTSGKFKTNYHTHIDGAAMGARQGFARFHVTPSMSKAETAGNAVQHEYAHAFQGHQPGFLTGAHWESHANFLREVWADHLEPVLREQGKDIALFGDNKRKTLEWSNLRQDIWKFKYDDYRIHYALMNYAEAFGADWDTVSQVWSQGTVKGKEVYTKLKEILDPTLDMKSLVAYCVRHWPFLDFAEEDRFKSDYWKNANEEAWFKYLMGSHLIPCADKANWYRVPFERAPHKFGWMSHELIPHTNTVTAEVRGLDLPGEGEDWRWSFAATDAKWENVRYSDVFAPGAGSFALKPGESKLFLIVVATPEDPDLQLKTWYNLLPEDKHPDRLHYAYEVRLENADPAITTRQMDRDTNSGRVHSNGGGWVANTASVHSSAYVGPHARVLDTAKVQNNACIEDYAVVMDKATVRHDAIVSGHAVVADSAIVEGQARIRDRAYVFSSGRVSDNAVVEDYASVRTGITEKAIVRGCSRPGSTVTGTAIADSEFRTGHALRDGVHFNNLDNAGSLADDNYYTATQTKPYSLIASYRFDAPNGDIAWDEFGAQHALLRGQPARVTDSGMNSAVLQLNGSDQYMVLDRSVCDLAEGSIGLWCKPKHTNAQPLLYLSGISKKLLSLAIDSSERVTVLISDGKQSQSLISSTTVSSTQWTYLAVTFDGHMIRLYVNGGLEDNVTSTLMPMDALGANDYTENEHYYAGRNAAGDTFAGSLEDIRFYNSALTDTDLLHEHRRKGSCLYAAFIDTPTTFSSPAAGHDYLKQGVAGTVWSGLHENPAQDAQFIDISAGTDPTYPGTLRMASKNGHFNHQGNDAPFLYIDNVVGDFVATVEIPALDQLSYNVAGLMARVGNLAVAGNGEDFVQAQRRGWSKPPSTQLRNLDDGKKSDRGTGADAPWIRLERVGNVFTMLHSQDGKQWTTNSSVTRNDLSGLPLQVGLVNAGYNAGERSANFDNFSLQTETQEIVDDFGGSDILSGIQSGIRDGHIRVLEASIYPQSSANVSYYEGIFDASDEAGGSYQGSGLGLDNGRLVARLENKGFWNTNVKVNLNQWQKVALAYDGRTATLYVNGQERARTSYSASENDVAGKNFRIGFAMDRSEKTYHFNGQIKDVFIYDKIPTQSGRR